MRTVNMLEAKTSLSRLVESVEAGEEAEIVIARNGRPAARLLPMASSPVLGRIGIARGAFEVPDDIDGSNAEIAALFGVPPDA
jgi:prevent-host-death family protein